jgi:predicted neutral ceramidase superfamily lipid hydrolase
MFTIFLNIIIKSLKLDKTLYRDNKNFGEAAIYFAGLIIILGGIAGAIAANTIIKTPIAMSGLTQILNWLVWSILIYVIGVKIFPDKGTKVSFKKVLISVGYANSPGLLRFFAVTPDLMIPIIIISQFWILASLIISTKQILNLDSNIKSFSIILLSFLIIIIVFASFVLNRMDSLPISSIS